MKTIVGADTKARQQRLHEAPLADGDADAPSCPFALHATQRLKAKLCNTPIEKTMHSMT